MGSRAGDRAPRRPRNNRQAGVSIRNPLRSPLLSSSPPPGMGLFLCLCFTGPQPCPQLGSLHDERIGLAIKLTAEAGVPDLQSCPE